MKWNVEETWVEEEESKESRESRESEERSVRRALKFDSDGCADSPFLENRLFTLDSSQEETIVIWVVSFYKQTGEQGIEREWNWNEK